MDKMNKQYEQRPCLIQPRIMSDFYVLAYMASRIFCFIRNILGGYWAKILMNIFKNLGY